MAPGGRARVKHDQVLVELMIAQIDPMVWYVHFGELGSWEAGCRDCTDHKHGLCRGGRDPVQCMKNDRHSVEIAPL